MMQKLLTIGNCVASTMIKAIQRSKVNCIVEKVFSTSCLQNKDLCVFYFIKKYIDEIGLYSTLTYNLKPIMVYCYKLPVTWIESFLIVIHTTSTQMYLFIDVKVKKDIYTF